MRLILLLVLLVGCVPTTKTVEIEDLSRTVAKARDAIEQCLSYNDVKACDLAVKMIDENHWIADRKASLSNRNGMRSNEWDLSKQSIAKDFKYIDEKYSLFRIKSNRISKPGTMGEWCYKNVDCSADLKCQDSVCVPESFL